MERIMLLNFRSSHAAIFAGCAVLLLTAIYVEPFASMDPCPMCMMQRAVFIALGVISLMAALHGPGPIGQCIYSGITSVTAGLGAAIAGRQIWLQNLPEDQVPACGPGLEYMLEVFPLLEVIEMAITGTGDCAKVQWTLFNISIPGWSLMAFIAIALLAIALFVFSLRTRKNVSSIET